MSLPHPSLQKSRQTLDANADVKTLPECAEIAIQCKQQSEVAMEP